MFSARRIHRIRVLQKTFASCFCLVLISYWGAIASGRRFERRVGSRGGAQNFWAAKCRGLGLRDERQVA